MHVDNQAHGSQAVRSGFLGRSLEASLVGLGKKLRHFLTAPGSHRPAPDSETLHALALQSERIKLRLLADAGQFDELFRIATQTDDEDLATVAVVELVNSEIDESEQIDFLIQLSKTFSRAAIPATVLLFNQRHVDLAQTIFLERLTKGEVATLVQEKKAKLFSVLDILGALDSASGTAYSIEYFQSLFENVAKNQGLEYSVLAEVLGDPKPEGYRYTYEPNMIGRAVKLSAISLLQSAPAAAIDRAFSYGANDFDEVIAHRCVSGLMNLWRSQSGMVPAGLEAFPMLDITLLTQLCQMSAAFQWQDSYGAESVLASFAQCTEQLEQLDTSSYAYEQTRHRSVQLQAEIVRITERRVNSLQPLVDRITNALGVPNASLAASDDSALCAAYLVGTGCIEINRRILLEDKPLSEELMSSLLHEIGHMEQDVLVIRMIADELHLKFGQHAQLLMPLYERYAAGIGYAPMSMFLLAVLRLRNDRILTPAQRHRATRLIQAAHQTKVGHEQSKVFKRRLDHLESSQQALEQGKYDSQLLSCLRDQQSLASLFNRGKVPAILLYEMNNCRQEIERVVTPLLTNDAITKRFGRAPDTIALSQQLYSSEYKHLVAPIVTRLKKLLLQVLTEENKRLKKKLSEIRRAGYHEAEAYTISDRVEVIVKALRKGW